ncbi:hypothetical protein H0A36_01580 [Endozoicomonas sp. SM1973]|uniref:protein-glutamate O-methyltransferase n=1 Tax=Spartinivicinus marinus TaxID=2994442 RepID=A0A853I1R5_9GAMM|nr:protein-glutamate O-methyltransferase CheR [Spartinivicinus marinus]MCX4030077.1 hypothetical protein [Spartinivicinus marinus]NYZ64678.1 hypothetical protein [Spartinivicinus marinus]
MKITDLTEQAVTDFIANRFGIHLQSYQIPYLHDAISSACEKFNYQSPTEYLLDLSNADYDAPELSHLINAITISESYFFRDTEQNQLLEEELLPRIIRQHRESQQLSLRIWSAGCAKGQEIYSIAIILHKLLPDIESWNIHLLATDINQTNLSDAIKGQYNAWSMRSTPEAIINQFFHVNTLSTEKIYQINDQLRSLVKFSFINLSQDQFPNIWSETNNLDLILCRNVFIYLSKLAKPKIIEKFINCLKLNGILIFSASDLINYHSPWLTKYQFLNREFFVKIKQPDLTQDFINDAFPSSASNYPSESTTKEPPSTQQENNNQTLLVTIQTMMTSGHWVEASKLCDQLLNNSSLYPVAIQYKAKALANIGKLDEASNLCLVYIKSKPLDKHGYLIYSLILIEQGEYQHAVDYLKKAIYIDSKFLEAYYHYGLLQIRLGKIKQGIEILECAANLVNQQNAHYIVHNTVDETYEHLAHTIKEEISMYQSLDKVAKS